jgi:hypothetical protein
MILKVTITGMIGLLLASCSTPKLPSEHTAYEQFAALNNHDKATAATFYALGQGDTVKRTYWAQRRSQETGGVTENQGVQLQRRYVNLPSPAYEDPDGTQHEASTHAVEIVQLWSITSSHGRPLLIVK